MTLQKNNREQKDGEEKEDTACMNERQQVINWLKREKEGIKKWAEEGICNSIHSKSHEYTNYHRSHI